MADLHITLGNKRYSSWSMRPWLALKATGLPFTEDVFCLGSDEMNDWLAANSPNRKVPLLQHGDLKIWDSLAIIEYLAELAPEAGLWPQDRAARAIARSVSAEMHSGFQPLRQSLGMNVARTFPGFAVPEAAQADIDRLQAIWAECRKNYGAGGPFLFGAFSAADCMYAPVVTRFVTYDVKLTPESQAYVDAMLAQPFVAEWIAAGKAEPWVVEKYEAVA